MWLKIIRLLMSKTDILEQLIELIDEILGIVRGGTAFALTEDVASSMGSELVNLRSTVVSAGFSWFELIQFLIENKDLLLDLRQLILDLIAKR